MSNKFQKIYEIQKENPNKLRKSPNKSYKIERNRFKKLSTDVYKIENR